jgi:hypothetical protein
MYFEYFSLIFIIIVVFVVKFVSVDIRNIYIYYRRVAIL